MNTKGDKNLTTLNEYRVAATNKKIEVCRFGYQLMNETGTNFSLDYGNFMAHLNLEHLFGIPLTIDRVAELMTADLEMPVDPFDLAHVCLHAGIVRINKKGELHENAFDFGTLFNTLGIVTDDSTPQGSFSPFGAYVISQLYLDSIEQHN